MEIYQLTQKGNALAHNIYGSHDSARWSVIYFLKQRGQATKEQILRNVPSATGHTLYWLRSKGIIQRVGTMVEV